MAAFCGFVTARTLKLNSGESICVGFAMRPLRTPILPCLERYRLAPACLNCSHPSRRTSIAQNPIRSRSRRYRCGPSLATGSPIAWQRYCPKGKGCSTSEGVSTRKDSPISCRTASSCSSVAMTCSRITSTFDVPSQKGRGVSPKTHRSRS